MPRTAERGGPATRARIAEVASRLFIDRGFDAVTVTEVAREAGVSSVTVFKHFPRKEDLYLDRSAEAEQLLRSAAHDHPAQGGAIPALRAMSLHLLDTRHPLSGLDERSAPFFRTVAGSPALVARAREIAAELQRILAGELAADGQEDGELLAAFFIAGYATVLTGTARRLVARVRPADLAQDHRTRLEGLFTALEQGLPSSASSGPEPDLPGAGTSGARAAARP